MAILKGVKSEIDVKVTAVIDGDMNTTTKVPFVVRYKKPTFEEGKEIRQRLAVQTPEDEEETGLTTITDEEIAENYIVDWKNVPTSTGEPFEFNPENLEEMMSVREYRRALVQGFLEVLLGKEALRKNSSRRGVHGP